MITQQLLDELKSFSTPSVLNGLKKLGLPPDRMETADRGVAGCISPGLGVSVGFAVTRRIATRRSGGEARPFPSGWDQGILSVPAPRFLVVENVGDWQGPVCIWGEVAAHINVALECRAGLTNGPVRDVDGMEAVGFQTFANGVGPGGGYVDTLEIGGTVTVAGLTVSPGDLIHGDRHGVVKVPLDLAPRLPEAIRAVEAWEQQLFDICRSPQFDIRKLDALLGGKK